MDDFTDVQFIDRGRFATVLKAKNIETNETVALKKIWVKSRIASSNSQTPSKNSNFSLPQQQTHNTNREIALLQKLNHPHVISLLSTFKDNDYIVLVLEHMSIDLHNLLRHIGRSVTELETQKMITMLISGLNAIHCCDMIHRDLKPANLLFNRNGILKITDFGHATIVEKSALQQRRSQHHKSLSNNNLILSHSTDLSERSQPTPNSTANSSRNSDTFSGMIVGSHINLAAKHNRPNSDNSLPKPTPDEYKDASQLTNEVGTRWYKAPEMLYGSRNYDNSIDIWALGCIIAEILRAKPLFCGETDIDQLCRIFEQLGTIDIDTYPEATQLPDFQKIVFDKIESQTIDTLWSESTDDRKPSKECLNLMQQCLQTNPSARINCIDACKHKWVLSDDAYADNGGNVNSVSVKALVETASLRHSEWRKKQLQRKNNEEMDIIECLDI